MLVIKSTVTQMKTAFDSLIRLEMSWERISLLQLTSIETSQMKNKENKNNYLKTYQNTKQKKTFKIFGTISKDVTCVISIQGGEKKEQKKCFK